MKRKIVMTLAMSLDGYIADQEGGFDWIAGNGDAKLDTPNKWNFDQFLEEVDLVVMGKNCYDQGMHLDFHDKIIYVATSKEYVDHDQVHFIKGDICEIIDHEQTKSGKNIFLFGGGILVDQFIKKDMIDDYIIGIIPIILGKGRPLFLGNNPTIKMDLTQYAIEEGIVVLYYSKRGD